MKFIFGEKIGMSRMYKEGKLEAVTLIRIGNCFVTRLLDAKKDGYSAIQVGYKIVKKGDGRVKGSLNKAGIKENLSSFAEFRIEDLTPFKIGDKIDISQFKIGDSLSISGVSKGKGFAGVMKRHGFHGAPHSHGHKHDWRAPGSINSGHPQHVMKGRRMGGRMGGENVTSKNSSVLDINVNENVLAVKGALPGKVGTWLRIRGN
ncbi:MAG: 50S ribosomal protein L3 [Patescibacteria group bacterium]|nr:50S ribosomal protein L3 [Patescibacteria group bacterium]